MRQITLTVSLPDRLLLPNQMKGKHWGTIFRLRKRRRGNANLLARSLLGRQKFEWDGVSKIPVHLKFYFKQSRPQNVPDRDNCQAWMKAELDGIADGIGINDRNFAAATVAIVLGWPGMEKCEITVGENNGRP